jgi:hypothetical protein
MAVLTRRDANVATAVFYPIAGLIE